MRVDDDTEAFEIVEIPVDRRDVDFGSHGLDLGAELLSGAMAMRIKQRP
jgi:hypothetical protein